MSNSNIQSLSMNAGTAPYERIRREVGGGVKKIGEINIGIIF